MDPRLARAPARSLAAAAALAVAGLAGTVSLAQQNSLSQAPAESAPTPTAPPVIAPPPASTPPLAIPAAPPPAVTMAPVGPPANEAATAEPPPPANVATPAPEKSPALLVPPRPVRGQLAVLQVLDKVTAETLRFQVPVGGRVRYKTLLIEVKVCETRGLGEPLPKPSAYLDVTSDPHITVRETVSDRKQVFKGWMFANAPGVHALQHPTYDLWLITCGAGAAPPAPAVAN